MVSFHQQFNQYGHYAKNMHISLCVEICPFAYKIPRKTQIILGDKMEAHTLQCADNLDHALTLIHVHNSDEHVLQAMCRVAYMIRHGVLLNVETFATNNV